MAGEHEMRVTREGRPADEGEIRAALAAIDPAATLRLATETGIVHVASRFDTLDLIDALAKAGLEARAATG